jgi:hypothetical protein
MRLRSYFLISCSALLALSLARVLAQTGGGEATPPPSDRPAAEKTETPRATAAPSGNRPDRTAGKEAEEPLKVVRWVCTDRICGHCDGQCSRRKGHVAVSRRGHCACTPEEGSALDEAIREAYRKRQKGS